MKYHARIERLVSGYALTAVKTDVDGSVYSEYEVDILFGTVHQAMYYYNSHKQELRSWL